MRQQTLANDGFDRSCKRTRRVAFLLEMDQIIPWRDLRGVMRPFYPKRTGAGRRRIGLGRMLRIHFLQHWFNLPKLVEYLVAGLPVIVSEDVRGAADVVDDHDVGLVIDNDLGKKCEALEFIHVVSRNKWFCRTKCKSLAAELFSCREVDKNV
jgi:glycosyltransferase involved in cell wall biosynthesis